MPRRAIAALVLVSFIAVPAFALIPAPAPHAQSAGCHDEPQPPSPQPSSSVCCLAGHQHALLQSSFGFQLAKIAHLVATGLFSPVSFTMSSPDRAPLAALSPPLTPLRI